MRLLVSDEWFDVVSSEGQYETDFESIVVAHAVDLFPQFHVIRFRAPVESEDGRKIPDLALLDREYRFWWVVEVEMAHHSLASHVLPQVEVFARGKYSEVHADYMAAQRNDLDRVALQDMVKGAQPRVLVIVNRNVPDWIAPIRNIDGLVTIIEVFRSGRNRHILRVNGDYPLAGDSHIASRCRLDSVLPNLLLVDSPASLGVASGESIAIEFNGGLTRWSRVDVADRVWLTPSGRNPLAANTEYVILRDTESQFLLREES